MNKAELDKKMTKKVKKEMVAYFLKEAKGDISLAVYLALAHYGAHMAGSKFTLLFNFTKDMRDIILELASKGGERV